jgi:hypothetical protein
MHSIRESQDEFDDDDEHGGSRPKLDMDDFDVDERQVRYPDDDDWGEQPEDTGQGSDDDYDRGEERQQRISPGDGLFASTSTPNRQPPHFDRDANRKLQYDKKRPPHDSGKSPPRGDQQAKRNGCWKLLQSGTCEHGENCRFSHEPAAMRKLYEDFEAMVKSNARKYGTPPERKAGGVPASSSD